MLQSIYHQLWRFTMKKTIIAAAIAVCGVMSVPAQAAQADLSNQPWYLVGMTLAPTGNVFKPLMKICYWKRGVYSAGILTSETTVTYGPLIGYCPAPTDGPSIQ